ncbi:MAG: Crp/Fnr family transcriptional regulator [Muribaculaceae bacterium]|nr:Crp/Fnr family transcriptional regulator [Muribaculaceae bacterium]MDE5858239.1 Crp/Fnr family transcriptional regulator [Muribaculaceae bacterium]
MAQFNAFEDAVDFAFWKEICETHGKLQHYRRGDYFVHVGEVMKFAGWIVSGGFKHSLIDNNGNAKAVGFVFEGSILANYVSISYGKKMPTEIIALEDSDVLVVPAAMIRDRILQDPTLHIRFSDALFEQAYEHVLNDYRSTPEQRYRQILMRYPRLFEVVSLGEIASYLNISRRQLHRIRETIPDDTTKTSS